ncbi:MAG TPA: hypothetical protein VJ935_11660 [Acidimicrobiia bacterium]|nr:hypothetical protein [Acidimicrobiia bacterium]
MLNQSFIITVSGLALSLAGFAAVIASLRGGVAFLDPINTWRVKAIVGHSLSLMILSLLLVPIHTWTRDLEITVRIGSALLFLLLTEDLVVERKRDPELWPGPTWLIFITGNVFFVSLAIGNLFWANAALLELGLVLRLASPGGIFYNYISELRQPTSGRGPSSAEFDGGLDVERSPQHGHSPRAGDQAG